jgi:short-subunit dehydrogenase involved in D-alanine esterification of teichoic acids
VFVCDIAAKALENLKQEVPGVATKVCDVSKREYINHMIAFGVKP